MKLGRTFPAIAGATMLLSVLVATASARTFLGSSQTARATFPRVNLSGVGTTECALTLEGSMHSRTVAKVRGSLIGYITRAVLNGVRCLRGSATILNTSLPWHVRYDSFTGTLPSISKVNQTVVGVQFNIKEPVFGIECLASGGTLFFVGNREAGGAATSAEISGTSPTSCGINVELSGTSNALTVLGAATRITVTLI
jgi:hypothetical protein